jgi:DNA mismatch endonuclease (patch repair protein)
MVDAFQALMADIVDKATRSRMMRGIRGKDTKPELRLRRAIRALGKSYRLGAKGLPFRPDLVFPGRRIAVFVHGCFWHRHTGCRYATTPSSNRESWLKKFETNIERDARVEQELRALGWRVATIWECELRNEGQARDAATKLLEWTGSCGPALEIGAPESSSGLRS